MLSHRPGSCRQASPTVPSRPRFSPLLMPIPKLKVLASSLGALSARVRPAGAVPWPRARAAINRRLPAWRCAGRAAAAGQPGKRSSGGALWPHKRQDHCSGSSWVSLRRACLVRSSPRIWCYYKRQRAAGQVEPGLGGSWVGSVEMLRITDAVRGKRLGKTVNK